MTFKHLCLAFQSNNLERARMLLEQHPHLKIANPERYDFIMNVVKSNNIEFVQLLLEHMINGEYVFKNTIHARNDQFINVIIRKNHCNTDMLRYIMSTEDKLGKFNIANCVSSTTTNDNAKFLLTLMNTHGQIQCGNFDDYVSAVAHSGNMDMLIHLIDNYSGFFDIHHTSDDIIRTVALGKDNLYECIEYLLSLTPRFGPFNVRAQDDYLLYFNVMTVGSNVDAIRLLKEYDPSITIDFNRFLSNVTHTPHTMCTDDYCEKMITMIDFLFSCDYVINKDIHHDDDSFFIWAFENMNDKFIDYLLDYKRWGYYIHIHHIFSNYSSMVLYRPQDYIERFKKVIIYHRQICNFNIDYDYMEKVLPNDYLRLINYSNVFI